MKSELVFLTQEFFDDHPTPPFHEFVQKLDRPYIVLLTQIEGVVWGLPFRSHINHQHAFWTDKNNLCGIDYSKSVVVNSSSYIDHIRSPYLRENEFATLQGKNFLIAQGFVAYIKEYKRARLSKHSRYQYLVEYSTLQNYESIIFTLEEQQRLEAL